MGGDEDVGSSVVEIAHDVLEARLGRADLADQ